MFWRSEEETAGKMLKVFQNTTASFKIDLVQVRFANLKIYSFSNLDSVRIFRYFEEVAQICFKVMTDSVR